MLCLCWDSKAASRNNRFRSFVSISIPPSYHQNYNNIPHVDVRIKNLNFCYRFCKRKALSRKKFWWRRSRFGPGETSLRSPKNHRARDPKKSSASFLVRASRNYMSQPNPEKRTYTMASILTIGAGVAVAAFVVCFPLLSYIYLHPRPINH